MIEYKVLADDPQKGLVVQGNFAPGSIPVNIPHSNPKRKQYISLFLNLRDIEAGIDYLQCISPNNHLRINEGLFISALALSAKCFVTSESRIGLDKQGFKKYSPQSKPIFDRYDAWRNKHFLHDENSMTEAIAFLLVSPAGSENVFGGSPSVVWNSVQVNYLQEGKQLESLLQEIRKYIMSSIDKKGDSIAQEYCNCTREEYSFETCTTLRQYDDYIKKVAGYLDMSISEITPANILLAVSKVAKECKYQEATVKTIISALRDIFSYAATCGHAYNILSKNRAGDKSNNLTTLMIQRILAPAMANAELKELNDSCPRALTIGQQGRLALYAAEHVLEDGRFCGILISLYTGIRPAECRGLRWNDFRSFPDHPDRHYLKVDEILNDKLEYSRQLKTKNALRCIPVHIEIEGALQKRKKFVQQNMGENTDIGELPIVCFENEFKDPCRGPDYSNFAFKLLKEFGVSSEQLGFSLLDEFDNLTPSDSHPPMRILRRNFATVIQACTDLSLEEKEYIFGHRISGKDGAKKRIEYNRNMDRLWRIAQKLDKAPFCKKLYELHFPQIIVGDGIVVQEGRGQGTIRIPWESAVYGQKLHLHFEGGPNTSVSISTPNAVRPFGGLPVEVKMADAPISWGDPLPPINAEAMHWEAVRKVRYLKKTDK